jgi:hypothetical protein
MSFLQIDITGPTTLLQDAIKLACAGEDNAKATHFLEGWVRYEEHYYGHKPNHQPANLRTHGDVEVPPITVHHMEQHDWSFTPVNGSPDTLAVFWGGKDPAHPFPAKLNATQTWPILQNWLQEATLLNPPDTDGHNERGFRLFNSHIHSLPAGCYPLYFLQPAWITYGK